MRTDSYTMSDLRLSVMRKFHLSEEEAKGILDFVFGKITEQIKRGKKVRIRNLGTFCMEEFESVETRSGKIEKGEKRKYVRFEDRVYWYSDKLYKGDLG